MCFSVHVDREQDNYDVPARTVTRSPRPLSGTYQVERRTPRSSAQRLSQIPNVVESSSRRSHLSYPMETVLRAPRSPRRSVEIVERSPRTSRQSVQLMPVLSRRGSYAIPSPDPYLAVPSPMQALEVPAPQSYAAHMSPAVPSMRTSEVQFTPTVPPPAPMAPTAHELRSRPASVRRPHEAPTMQRERSGGQQSSASSQGRDRRTTVENERGIVENITKIVTTVYELGNSPTGVEDELVEAQRTRATSGSRDSKMLESPPQRKQSFRLAEERIKYDDTGRRTMQYQYQ